MSDQSRQGSDTADARGALVGGEGDAVDQARQWLADRGLPVPGPEEGPSVMRSAAVASARRPVRADASPPESAAGPPPGPGTASPLGRASFGADSEPDPEAVARTIVLRKLAAQARSRAELHTALQRKEVPPEAAEAVLDRMEAVGLVDDAQLARDWVESRQQRRYLSRTALRRELTAKGVDKDQIDSALERVDSEAELEAARALVAKKVGSMTGLEAAVRYRRLAGLLGRRGFTSSVISQVVDESVGQAAD